MKLSKYLGIDIQVKGLNFVKSRETRMVAMARSYADTIVRLTRSDLNRALIARKLWECSTIPVILYSTEAMTITATTVTALESIQVQVARFILQLPLSEAYQGLSMLA